MRICEEIECERKHWAKGLCGYHYDKQWRTSESNRRHRESANSNQYHRRYIKSWRQKVLDKFNNKCNKCGFDDFRALQVDHVFNDGNQERKLYRVSGGLKFYKTVLADSEGRYQLLCANCNYIKKYENIIEKFGPIKDEQ